MDIKEIKYMFRRNLGNYEHEELTMTAVLEEGDDLQDSIDTIKEKTKANLGEYMENEVGKKKKKATKKSSKKAKEEEEDEEEEIDEEEEESEDDSDGDEDSDEEEEDEDSEEDDEDEDDSDDEDDEDEEDEEPVKKKAKGKSAKSKSASASKGKSKKSGKTPKPGKAADGAKSAAKKKTFRSKLTPYDPKKQLHAKLVGEVVESKYKNWRKKESLVKKSIKASEKMKGKEFLNNDGEVTPEFKKAFLKLMK